MVTMPPSKPRSEKERQVLEAAFGVFYRYGFARTTMADLASAAGLSRPALYLVYAGKAEVFEAVVDWFVDRMLEEIVETLDAAWPLERQLLHVAELAVARGYDMLAAHPDAADLMSPERHGPALLASFERLQVLLADLLRGPLARGHLKTTADDLARILMAAMKGFKIVAKDGKELRQLIATQVQVTVAAIGEPSAPAAAPAKAHVHKRTRAKRGA